MKMLIREQCQQAAPDELQSSRALPGSLKTPFRVDCRSLGGPKIGHNGFKPTSDSWLEKAETEESYTPLG